MKKVFTNKELVILKLVAQEKTSIEIANQLKLSKKTIDRHRYNICKKLNISGSNSLLKFTIKNKDTILNYKSDAVEYFKNLTNH